MVLYRMLNLSLTDLVCTVSDPLFSPAARSDYGLTGEVDYLTGVRVDWHSLVEGQ